MTSRVGAVAALVAGCAALPPRAPVPPSRTISVSIAPETVVNDPVLANRGAELRTALSQALAEEGFRVEPAAPLVALTSIDYTPWTPVNAASIYVVVKLQRDGITVDEASVQRINEGFPEPAKVPDLARQLAHALAT